MKKKIALAFLCALALLCLAGCAKKNANDSDSTPVNEEPTGQTEEQQESPVVVSQENRDEFPIPDGETFGLTGEEATLYSAAAQVLCADTLDGDLMLPSLTLYGQYDNGDGNVSYVCELLRAYYYDLDLSDPKHPSYSGTGGVGNLARITVSNEGVCTAIDETYDGDTVEGRANRISELCGPLTDLASALTNETAAGKQLTPNDYKEMLSAYVKKYF